MKPVEMQTRSGPKGTEHPMWAPALLPALPGLARGASGPPKLCRARGTIQKEGPFDRLAKSVLFLHFFPAYGIIVCSWLWPAELLWEE